ncbi:hypothetical protein GCM10027610_140750 [Dactylosporangium cerinum]
MSRGGHECLQVSPGRRWQHRKYEVSAQVGLFLIDDVKPCEQGFEERLRVRSAAVHECRQDCQLRAFPGNGEVGDERDLVRPLPTSARFLRDNVGTWVPCAGSVRHMSEAGEVQ